MATHRSPNAPLLATSTPSPGERRFCNAPSKAPVMLEAKRSTSLSVTSSRPRFPSTLVNTCAYAWVRSSSSGSTAAAATCGGVGVGPGTISRYFFMSGEVPFLRWAVLAARDDRWKTRPCGPQKMTREPAEIRAPRDFRRSRLTFVLRSHRSRPSKRAVNGFLPCTAL